MTDTVPTEGPVPQVLPAADFAAEVETAAPEPAAIEASASGEAPAPAAERAHPEIEYAIGATRQAVLDHFIDTEGDQSMAQIKAALPNVLPGTVEACVRREWEAGRLLRVSPGVYRLAPPPKPAEPKQAPPPKQPEVLSDEEWLAAMDVWFEDRSSWDVQKLGPPPNEPGNWIPPSVRVRFADRVRKQDARRREREEADAKLRNQLIPACHGNFMPGPGLSDMATIRSMLQVVPIDHILLGLKRAVDRRIDPRAAPIASWKDERFLRAVARSYALDVLVPSMVDSWSKAGTPAKRTRASEPSPGTQEPVRRMNSSTRLAACGIAANRR